MIAIRPAAAVAALLLVAATATACSQSPTTDGAPVAATDTPAATPSTVTASASPSPSASAVTSTVTSSAPQTSVVVVTAPGERRTVTRVVQAPDQSTPQSSSSLLALYDDSTTVDSSDYYNGDGLFFDSPSQNIGCYLTDGDYVTCSIHRYGFPQPGPDCDRGIAATLDSSGYSDLTDCSGYFPVADRGTVLQYGESVSDGDVACISEPTGVSCLNLDTDTGFTLAREAFSPVF